MQCAFIFCVLKLILRLFREINKENAFLVVTYAKRLVSLLSTCNNLRNFHLLQNLFSGSMTRLQLDCKSNFLFTDDLPSDRNCDRCVNCCVDYDGWLQFQNCLYKVVRDPLFELAITLCIVLNTFFLALEHHGMSENVRQALDIGNKVSFLLYFLL